MKNLKNSVIFKILTIALLVVILLIPASMIESLIYERENRQSEAIQEVSDKWSHQQTIHGPYLSIPYDKKVKIRYPKDSVDTWEIHKEWLQVLPNQLNITGKVNPERRYRGIYEVVVYQSELQFTGDFGNIDLAHLDIPKEDIHFDQATLNIGISDLRGIEETVILNWGDEQYNFLSGTATDDIATSGINSIVDATNIDSSKINYSINLKIKGSQSLDFLPLGKTTDVTLISDWTTPSFSGAFLPDSREITTSGFKSTWNVLYLNRNYPQVWKGSRFRVNYSMFGVNLLLPIDSYQKTLRVAKYAILFLALTFMVFFFVEIMNKKFIHPIQYLLVGIALIVFYTLLLSISEHLHFDQAYFISTILTLLLIAGYTLAITKSKKIAALLSGILTILYVFIFILLQLEDYALLIGSIGIFVITATVMYISRKIDWYEIKVGQKEN
jgi:inner membrane protein